MENIEDMLGAVANLERKTFEDAWSMESIKDSLKYDYNYILLAYGFGEDMEFVKVRGCDAGYQNATLFYDSSRVLDHKRDFAGYLTYSLLQDESELLRVATVSDYRKKGIGKALVKKYHEEIFKEGVLGFLEVRENNEAARKLYEKTGYAQIGVRKNYYKNPSENGIIYQITF